MASLTIRRLDEDLKQRLRVRAAGNGRSMEDEARIILGEAAAGENPGSPTEAQRRHDADTDLRATESGPDATPSGPRILLIIGGGISAYKSLDLIRRLRERGASVRCIL